MLIYLPNRQKIHVDREHVVVVLIDLDLEPLWMNLTDEAGMARAVGVYNFRLVFVS